MPPRSKTPPAAPVSDYRHDDARRKNNPPAGLAPQAKVQEAPKLRFSYDPHRPPVLRFDDTGESDRAGELLAKAQKEPLSREEAKELAELLRNREPWLEWAGKREVKGFVVDPVALHIHERVSTQAILRAVERGDVQKELFADPQQPFGEAVQFYRHDVDWANRLILGDSLQVMASLARREDLAGKVQMIYIDPPYGIKFASNFQPIVGRRDVKDKEQDLTRESEMVKAYRDTWTLGVHSYLAYLRDRLILARELLTDSGSIFVRTGDENVHRVRAVLDEVFGAENAVSVITFVKTTGASSPKAATNSLAQVADHILWYAKNTAALKYRQLYRGKAHVDGTAWLQCDDGSIRRTQDENDPQIGRIFSPADLTSQTVREAATTVYSVEYAGRRFLPGGTRGWATSPPGFARLIGAQRILTSGSSIRFIRYIDDFPVAPINNVWTDTIVGQFTEPKVYVVQTSSKVIERCLLMTTDPGDLVLDPTCGSGTAAYVAEQWGRRWITIDTSRVALSLARQRLMTATFPHYAVRGDDASDGEANPARGFVYKTVPHITLKSIAQNVALDPIFERHQPMVDAKLAALNQALQEVSPALRQKLKAKLAEKQKREGKRAISDADHRRWELPAEAWKEWEVPFDTDPDWPEALRRALTDYRTAWRAKMDEVNEMIAASAEQEELVDQPEVERGVTRVSGPFTVEAVMPAEQSLDGAEFGCAPEDDLETFDPATEPANAEAFLDGMLRYLRQDGVRFPNNKVVTFTRLDAVSSGDVIHAEGEWESENGGSSRRVAVSFGPQHGPVTASQVENALWAASRQGFDDLVFAGFSFDGTAQAVIQEDPNPRVRVHMAHVAPDVQMGGLLKTQRDSQLFTVFGLPRTTLKPAGDGEYTVVMEGVDVYDPVQNTIRPTGAEKVAAWFVDADYDGRTFCITQAFFPDRKAWDKIARALKGTVDEAAWEALSGTESLPFRPGSRVAVKVIDPRGNEVMRVHRLDGAGVD